MFVAGSNLFGQWFSKQPMFTKFHEVNLDHNIQQNSKLIQINWAYNIYSKSNIFYMSGSSKGKDHQLIEILIPDECKSSTSKYTIIGNDYNIMIIDINFNCLWFVNSEDECVKKVYLKTESIHTPKKICKNLHLKKAICTNQSSLFLSNEGSVHCGFLPTLIDTSHCNGNICDVAMGYEHFILLTDSGVIYTWGNGRRLQLGHSDISNLEIPTELEALSGIRIVKISAGGWHTLALSEFGDVYAWGWNDTGQLGIKAGKESTESLKSYSTPTLVDIYDENDTEVHINVKDIACGSRHSAILLDNNTVWTSGCNKYGQLGFSSEEYEMLTSFKQSFSCKENVKLMCGPWSTVITTL